MSIDKIIKELLGDSADSDVLTKIASAFEEEKKAAIDNEVKGLKNNQAKNLEQLAKLKKNQMPDGFSKDDYSKYLEEKNEFDKKQTDLEEKRLQDEGQWEHLKQTLVDKNKSVVEELTSIKDNTINSLRSALDKELIENASIKAIEKESGNSFFLLPHMKDLIKTVSKDGSFLVEVVDRDGNARTDDETGNPFTIGQLVAEMKSDDAFSLAFPNGNSGSGNAANQGGSSSNVVNPWKADSKNITEQAKMVKENPVLADQMKKAAGA
ncbi:MAG TPA: hypothetical protein ENK70_09070 [Methylophaga sp.]|nr:hypothetical protein [Methylophaga sp.]